MATYFRAFIFFLILVVSTETTIAANYPAELQGAWAGRAEFQGDDRVAVAQATCKSYIENRNKVQGDIIAFDKTQKTSLGGYADYTERNVAVNQMGPAQWQIVDRTFDDGEGGRKPGWKNVTYEAVLVGNTLSIKSSGQISTMHSCGRCVFP